jgi:hypothetical protein
MNKPYYTDQSDVRLQGLPALKEESAEIYDALLCGKHGCLFQISEKEVKAVFISPEIAARFGVKIRRGEEGGKNFSLYEVRNLAKALRVPKSRQVQLRTFCLIFMKNGLKNLNDFNTHKNEKVRGI